MKKFLISIDTEGDNLWSWRAGDRITTENAKYLPRFQELCESFGFKPTYLTNYEMATDPFFVNYFKQRNLSGKCEIGMHLHAWNNPPEYDLPIRTDMEPGAPYLIEYPKEIMYQKIKRITNIIKNNFDDNPVTHRAGRWTTNDTYFSILDQIGYKIDCSVTPGKDWSNACGQSLGSIGSNYIDYSKYPYRIPNTNLVEIPVTVRKNHRLKIDKNISIRSVGIKKYIKKFYESKKGYGELWLRPGCNHGNLSDLLYLVDVILSDSKADYLMFMLHSSEFMPGCSPTFPTAEDIEKLYENLIILFTKISHGFCGATFKEYIEGMTLHERD